MRRYRIGIIGFGNIAGEHLAALCGSDRWSVAWVCDPHPQRRAIAKEQLPGAHVVEDAAVIFNDGSLDAVALCAYADTRPELVRRALAAGLHICAEKPLAADISTERLLLEDIERSDRVVAVNLFNRNAWYHHEAQRFIDDGEIGRLGIIRVCHMTAGVLPGEGYEPEGSVFHNCGMHYVDLARWYARAEYHQWYANGLRMWGEPEPWWVSVHGTFDNGVAFEITNGFVYGQMAQQKRNASYTELIGTRGVMTISHDFHLAHLQFNGVSRTVDRRAPYGSKALDIMYDRLARAIDGERGIVVPAARDAVLASQLADDMLRQAMVRGCPAIGDASDLDAIRSHRAANSLVC